MTKSTQPDNHSNAKFVTRECSVCGISHTRVIWEIRGKERVYCRDCWPLVREINRQKAIRASNRKCGFPPFDLHSPMGKKLFKDRAMYAKCYVYLENMLKSDIKISIYEVMKRCDFDKPFDLNPRKYLVVEAAIRVGINIERQDTTLLFG